MKQVLTIAVVLSGMALLNAQADTSLLIEEVEISTNRINFNSREWGRTVKVLTKSEIQMLPVQSTAEALQMISGLDVRRRGPNNVQSDISMRGGSFDQVLILINGVRMNDAQTGHHTLYLPVELDDIERIEIVKGPAAKNYGQNAFSGAINIITKVPTTDKIKAAFSYGSFNTIGMQAGLSKQLLDGKWRQNFAFSGAISDGFEYNRDYSIFNYFYDSRVSLSPKDELTIFGGYTERKFGANGFYALPSFKEQYEEVQTSIGAVKLTHTAAQWRITPGVSWRRNFDDYLFVRNDPAVFRNRTLGNRVTADVHASQYNKLGTLGIGIEYSKEYLRSLRLGDHDRSIFGAYLEQKFQIIDEKLIISPGVYVNKFSDADLQILPGIDVSFYPDRSLKIYGAANVANRLPTYTDLYYSSSVEQGNPNLQSEKVKGYEAGLEYKNNGLTIGIGAYINYTNGLIDWTKTNAADPKWTTNNYAATIIKGLEADVEFDVNKLLKTNNILKLNLSGSFIDASSNEKDNTYITRYQFNHLGAQWISGIQAGFFNNKLVASLNFRKIDRVVEDIDPETGDDLFDAQLLDGAIMGNFGAFRVKFTANNLLGEKYKELGNVVMPGNWYDLKVMYTY